MKEGDIVTGHKDTKYRYTITNETAIMQVDKVYGKHTVILTVIKLLEGHKIKGGLTRLRKGEYKVDKRLFYVSDSKGRPLQTVLGSILEETVKRYETGRNILSQGPANSFGLGRAGRPDRHS